MIWVQIPLDMIFFLLYMCCRVQQRLSISIFQQLIITQIMLSGTQKSKAVMRMPGENKSKQNQTINYGNKAVHTHSRIF